MAVRKAGKKKKKSRSAFPVVLILAAVLVIFGIVIAGRFSDGAERLVYPTGYEEYVSRYAAKFSVPESVVYAVILTESKFDPDARSGAGAVGLMQLMPATYEWCSWRLGEETVENGRNDPETNIRCGTYLLSYLYSEFGDWDTVAAAFNAGDSRVKEWLEDPEISENGRLVRIPYPETENYVKKIRKAAEAYERLAAAET